MEVETIMKLVVALSWVSVLYTLLLRSVIKKKIPQKKIDLERIRKMKNKFLWLKKILGGSILVISLYESITFMLGIENIYVMITIPGILIPALIEMEIYISMMDHLLKKGGD